MANLKPDWAPFIYHDGRYIYLEFEKQVLRFERTDNGLHRALKTIPTITGKPGYVTGASNLINGAKAGPRPKLSRPKAKVPTFAPTEAVKSAAADAVKRLLAKRGN